MATSSLSNSFRNLFGTQTSGGFQVNPDLTNAFFGFAKAADKGKAPTSNASELYQGVVTTGLNAIIPGAGTLAEGALSITRNLTRNPDGTYKSTFAGLAENLTNPFALGANVLSGDFLGKKKQKSLQEEEKRRNFEKRRRQRLQNAVNTAPLIAARSNQFAPLFKKGGKVGCGCTKGKDGLDTDVFKEFPSDLMKTVQKMVGTKQDGIYKDKDKRMMKIVAAKYGMRLVDFVNSNNEVKTFLNSKKS